MPDKLQSGTSAKKHTNHLRFAPASSAPFILHEAVATISTHPMARIVARQLLQTAWSGLVWSRRLLVRRMGMPARHLLLPPKATQPPRHKAAAVDDNVKPSRHFDRGRLITVDASLLAQPPAMRLWFVLRLRGYMRPGRGDRPSACQERSRDSDYQSWAMRQDAKRGLLSDPRAR
ncbi:hypothetical protein S7711_10548 [Stachybotrys chartarum IBT 7711]|uniref:Uncharacterized protein n=1 Tax=Stachybotrys chartarum (strain CBS 109288 / IBT 7711) TaxID=1280523 RepID=A0A084ARJ2_STACB|nr:hypothetical protein S7711_10548 [Stachybotrys chartarum IBT 7711]